MLLVGKGQMLRAIRAARHCHKTPFTRSLGTIAIRSIFQFVIISRLLFEALDLEDNLLSRLSRPTVKVRRQFEK